MKLSKQSNNMKLTTGRIAAARRLDAKPAALTEPVTVA